MTHTRAVEAHDSVISTQQPEMSRGLLFAVWGYACICWATDVGSDRMRVEIDAQSGGEKREDLVEKEATARAGLDRRLKDSLKDIMAVLQHGSDASKEQACFHARLLL